MTLSDCVPALKEVMERNIARNSTAFALPPLVRMLDWQAGERGRGREGKGGRGREGRGREGGRKKDREIGRWRDREEGSERGGGRKREGRGEKACVC